MMEERNMKRKTLSLLLVLVMALSLLTACGAKDAPKEEAPANNEAAATQEAEGNEELSEERLAAEAEEVYEHVFPDWYNTTFTVTVPVPAEYDMENEADMAAFGEWISSLCTENEDGSVVYRLDKATHEAWLETADLWIEHMIDQQLGEAPVRVEVAEDYSSFVITTTGQLELIDSFLNTFPTSVASIAITVLPLLGVDPEQVSIRYIDGLSGTLMEERSLLEHLEQYNQTASEISFSEAYFDSSAMRALGRFEEWLTAQGYDDVKTAYPPHMGIDTTADPNTEAGEGDFVISDEQLEKVIQGMELLEQFS